MFNRILVPTDFSATSDAALEHARVFAERFGGSLHLLHVVEDQYATGPLGGEVYAQQAAGTLTSLVQEAQERLSHRINALDRSRFRATTEVIVGTAMRTIAEYAGDNGYDLIVMGTHGRTGLAHVLMGSVAEHVVRTAPCPVLTVRTVPARAAATADVKSAVVTA
jgi:nucleotide-binding universal stress UspA family protein